MQDLQSKDITPRDRALSAKALDTILERKRVLAMKPAPKAVDADKYKAERRRKQPATTEQPTET